MHDLHKTTVINALHQQVLKTVILTVLKKCILLKKTYRFNYLTARLKKEFFTFRFKFPIDWECWKYNGSRWKGYMWQENIDLIKIVLLILVKVRDQSSHLVYLNIIHKITNLWKFVLNWSSKLRDNNGRKNSTLLARSCVLSHAWFRDLKI